MTEDLGTPDNISPTGMEGYHHDHVDVTIMGGEAQRVHALDPGIRRDKGQRLRLLTDLVAIRPDPTAQKTAGGIHIPEQAHDVVHNTGEVKSMTEQYHTGTVLAVGPGRRAPRGGRRIPMDIVEGDRVRYHRLSGSGLVWDDGGLSVLVHADGQDHQGNAIAWVELEDGEST